MKRFLEHLWMLPVNIRHFVMLCTDAVACRYIQWLGLSGLVTSAPYCTNSLGRLPIQATIRYCNHQKGSMQEKLRDQCEWEASEKS